VVRFHDRVEGAPECRGVRSGGRGAVEGGRGPLGVATGGGEQEREGEAGGAVERPPRVARIPAGCVLRVA
jgi:hypothetical protein